MEDLKNKTNQELLDIISNLSQNHEKIKQEMIILNEILINIEKDYININEELKSRI
jgi:hemerythrin-like domain-containing protein